MGHWRLCKNIWIFFFLAVLAAFLFLPSNNRFYGLSSSPLRYASKALHFKNQSHPPAPACAIILEPRASLALLHAVRHMSKALPPAWPILVYHMADTRNFLHCSLFDLLESGRVESWVMEEGENAWKIQRVPPTCYPSLFSGERRLWTTAWGRDLANYFHFSRTFYDTLPTDKYLIFQPDGLLCSETEGGRLAEFMEYDMIGAPWNLGSEPAGGNGGFSLRSKAAMLKVLDAFSTPDQSPQEILSAGGVPEDGWFAERLPKLGAKLPLPALASSFSVEQHMNPRPLGFHKPWSHLKAEEMEQLYIVCPVLKKTEELMQYI